MNILPIVLSEILDENTNVNVAVKGTEPWM